MTFISDEVTDMQEQPSSPPVPNNRRHEPRYHSLYQQSTAVVFDAAARVSADSIDMGIAFRASGTGGQ